RVGAYAHPMFRIPHYLTIHTDSPIRNQIPSLRSRAIAIFRKRSCQTSAHRVLLQTEASIKDRLISPVRIASLHDFWCKHSEYDENSSLCADAEQNKFQKAVPIAALAVQ